MSSVKLPRKWKFGSVPAGVLDSSLSIHAKIVIAAITFHAFDDGPSWPGQARLSRLCSCSNRAVMRGIKELEKGGWLKVERTKGKVNVYEFIDNSSDSQSLPPIVQVTVSHLKPVTGSHTNETNINETTHDGSPVAPKGINIKPFTDWWCQEYANQFKKQYVFRGAKDAQASKRLLNTFKADEIKRLVKAGWADRDQWVRKMCLDIAGFSSVVNRITIPKVVDAPIGTSSGALAEHRKWAADQKRKVQ